MGNSFKDLFKEHSINFFKDAVQDMGKFLTSAGELKIYYPIYKVSLYFNGERFNFLKLSPGHKLTVSDFEFEEENEIVLKAEYFFFKTVFYRELARAWEEYSWGGFSLEEYHETISDIIEYCLGKVLNLESSPDIYEIYTLAKFRLTRSNKWEPVELKLLDVSREEIKIEKLKNWDYAPLIVKIYNDFVFTIDIPWIGYWIWSIAEIIHTALKFFKRRLLNEIVIKFL